MADFNKAYPKTVSNEGYYVSQDWFRTHGDRNSGETYMGVDRIQNPSWEGWAIIDRYKAQHGAIPYNTRLPQELGLEDMVKAEAKKKYWDAIHGDDIQDQDVAQMMFEQVWGGYGGITRIQKVINTMYSPALKIDGGVGRDTLIAVNSIDPNKLYQAIYDDRKNWIQTTGKKVNAKAVGGWLSRLERFRKDVSDDIQAASESVGKAISYTTDTFKRNPVLLFSGVAIVLLGFGLLYKYAHSNERSQ
jgi:lysozyme family protein